MITDDVELIAKSLETSEILKLEPCRSKFSRFKAFTLRNQRDDWSLSVHMSGLPKEGSDKLIDILKPHLEQYGKVQFITLTRDPFFNGEAMVEFADAAGAEACLASPGVFQDVTLATMKK